MDLQAIKDKIRTGQPVSHDELVWAIKQDKHLLFNFLMDNNLANINHTLRIDMGQSHLPFAPDRRAIEATINAYIVKNDMAHMNAILRGFEFNPNAGNYTTHYRFLQKLKYKLR